MPADRADPVPTWPQRWHRLLAELRRVPDAPARERLLDALVHPAGPRVLAFANAHALNLAARDVAFFEDLAAADCLLRDGQGMAWLLRLLRQRPGLNLNGTDLIPALVARFAQVQPGVRMALLGTRAPWLSRAGTRLQALAGGAHCLVADGFMPDDEYLRLAARESPHLVVLAMGMPRQERLARALRAAAQGPCLIICGGAIADFLGGRYARAPRWLQRLGLEWCWRLAREPRRLFGRYVLGNPLFLARALWLALSRRQPAAASPSARS
jgi:exopolysaccharide biosynthesis WecB/TagA/CpsF family protein